ncbi:MAG: 3'(2'),5'-bisphosphate nucleotidase [Armatimonadetes bacterium]|nr:3'(2'),5'-bisphosphate nucleotidase [Anaerolineae bacterium]
MNLDPIMEAVRRAATLCHEVQHHFLTENTKAGVEPVTIADYGAQALICEAISRAYPDDAVVAEEAGQQFLTIVDDTQRAIVIDLIGKVLGRTVTEAEVVGWLDFNTGITAPRTWVIDPIDGTKGFLAMRHFAIAVGVLESGSITAGVMGCPGYPGYAGGALMYAQDGKTYRAPMAGGEAHQVFASKITEAAQVRILESVEKSHASQDRMEKVRLASGLGASQLDRIDSQEKYARIAGGDGELYLRLPRLNSENRHMVWDHAAGAALVYAAGGSVTDIDGSPLDFTHGRLLAKNQGMIVSNGVLHEQILAGVVEVLKQEAAESAEG